MRSHALALTLAVLLGAASQLVLKSAFETSGLLSTQHSGSGVISLLWGFNDTIQNFVRPWVGEFNLPLLVLGLVFYILGMLLWMVSLQKFDLGKAYACLALSYVLVYLGSVVWPSLSESMTLEKSIGVCLVCLGVTLISSSPAKDPDHIESQGATS